jgi:hypothetical protein
MLMRWTPPPNLHCRPRVADVDERAVGTEVTMVGTRPRAIRCGVESSRPRFDFCQRDDRPLDPSPGAIDIR